MQTLQSRKGGNPSSAPSDTEERIRTNYENIFLTLNRAQAEEIIELNTGAGEHERLSQEAFQKVFN